MLYSNEENVVDKRVREFIIPQRILKTFGNVENVEYLLDKNSTQTLLNYDKITKLTTKNNETAGLLIDFGFEFCGGVCITVHNLIENGAKVRLSFGESVNEALSHIGEKNSTNDHNPRDFVVELSKFSTHELGNTGYRFLYIELLSECTVPLTAIQGIAVYNPYVFQGSFLSSDKRLNQIYNTAAHTCHMCIQNEIWDGIKRDRLVWIGDLYPEMLAIKYLFGKIPDVESALVFSCTSLSERSWINTIPTYSLWWIINACEWCFYTGDTQFFIKNKSIIEQMVSQVLDNTDENGVFIAGDFIDWPTNGTEATKEGVKALSVMFYKDVIELHDLIDENLRNKCLENLDKVKKVKCSPKGFKQIAALLLLNGLADRDCIELLNDGTVQGYSTFMSYFIFKALSQISSEEKTIDALKEYYGAMLDLGATTFWEDFDILWKNNACRIDEICPEGKKDVHGDNGRFCYEGFRHSLCHGWSSGPVPFLTEFVLGIQIIDKGCKKIRIDPHLGNLDFASGSIATPFGKLCVEHRKDMNGKVITSFEAPEEINVQILEK